MSEIIKKSYGEKKIPREEKKSHGMENLSPADLCEVRDHCKQLLQMADDYDRSELPNRESDALELRARADIFRMVIEQHLKEPEEGIRCPACFEISSAPLLLELPDDPVAEFGIRCNACQHEYFATPRVVLVWTSELPS